MALPEDVLFTLEAELDLDEKWSIHFVRGDGEKHPELNLQTGGVEIAAIGVVHSERETIIEVFHIDCPKWSHRNAQIPGHVGALVCETLDEAVEALEILTDTARLEEIIDRALSDETGTTDPLEEAISSVGV